MRRLLSLTVKKISVLFGGRPIMLPIALIALSICLAAAAYSVTREHSGAVSIAVTDECGGELSSRLVSEFENTEGFSVLLCNDRTAAEDALISGDAEAMLVIKPDYDERLTAGAAAELIDIVTVPGSVSAELIRETAAGKLLAAKSRAVVLGSLESEGFSTEDFDGFAAEFSAPKLYSVSSLHGGSVSKAVFGGGYPGYEGFAAMALMLLILTVTRGLSREEAKLVSTRMRVLKRGRAAAFASDLCAVLAVSLLFTVPVVIFAPERSPLFIAAFICYDILLTGLSLLLSRFGGGGRIDVASPFIALITSIIGGCFMDVSSLSPALLTLSRITPQGQLIAALRGSPGFLILILCEGVLMAFIAAALSGGARAKK